MSLHVFKHNGEFGRMKTSKYFFSCRRGGWQVSGMMIPLFLVCAISPMRHTQASEQIVAEKPRQTYQQALAEAERESLDRQAREEGAAGGWSLSDAIGLAALAVAIGLVFWASRWTRSLVFRQPTGREMRLVDRMAISRNSSLVMIEIRGRVYWLAEHPNGVTRLDDWPVTEIVPDGKAVTPRSPAPRQPETA